jgi:flagellar motor switch protein FliN/FliY
VNFDARRQRALATNHEAMERIPMADSSPQLGQDELDALLGQSQGAQASKPRDPAARPAADAASPLAGVSQDDIELLLKKAEQALASIDEPVDDLPPGVQAFQFADFAGAAPNSESATLELMRDVELDLTIELGRTHMHLEDVLKLKQGAVVPLDKLAGDPADIYVNGRLIARGEVLVLNDNFCVRVAELIVGESACP